MKRHLSFVAAFGMCFFASIPVAYAQVRADTGGIAIGGSVTGSTINIGVPSEQLAVLVRQAADLSETQKKVIAKLEGELDLNQRQIRAALGILGENDIPPERLADKLVEIAERFKALQATASAQPGDDPKIAALKNDAQKAIETGELAKADALLADVETEQRRSLDRLAINAVETSAQRGEIALTRLRYAEAAKHFANAAMALPPNSAYEDKRMRLLAREARALTLQGHELGDNDALRASIERFKRLVEMRPRVPRNWVGLGHALVALGQREGETTKLEEAVLTYREALKEATRELAPLQWATIQNNLGFALHRLGEREVGTAKFEEAVFAYREALKEATPERAPRLWAITQKNLAMALEGLGLLDEAVATYRKALKKLPRERAPRGWALTQNNLGHVLTRLGLLDEAVAAYREALKELTRERVPLLWARSQSSLALVLTGLGRLDEAVAAYHEALEEQTRERAPLEWAKTQDRLGVALGRLGERESGTAKLEEAVAAYREALKERTRERVPLDWAMSLGNEGVALMLLAERRRDGAMAETALSQINTAYETMRDAGHAPNAAYYERQLPRARALVARLRGQ
jgi:tetratricopeptide (TPR) repeat protein